MPQYTRYTAISVSVAHDSCIGTVESPVVTTNKSDEEFSTNFLSQYYSNLTYHGINVKGSCGYIAIGMWLSYYDTFWNDSIISESFDKPAQIYGTNKEDYYLSPGINDPICFSNDFLNDIEYKNYMYEQQTNFHAHLLSIGDDLGYISNNESNSFGLTFDETYTVLKHYLTSIGIPTDYFSFNYYAHLNDYASQYQNENYTCSEKMRQDIIRYVKNGIPVIVSIAGTNKQNNENIGHVVIAYDYNDENDILFAHFGWLGHTHTDIFYEDSFSKYSYIKGYIAAPIIYASYTHTHTNNYILPNGASICSCELSSHSHSYKYTNNGENNHTTSCYCGYKSVDSHQYVANNLRYLTCLYCGNKIIADDRPIAFPLSVEQIIHPTSNDIPLKNK